MCGWQLRMPACSPAFSIILLTAKRLNGPPRSLVNMNLDAGFCSCRSFRSARVSSPCSGCLLSLPPLRRHTCNSFLDQSIWSHCISTASVTSPRALSFVEVKLAGPDHKQARLFDTDRGGLWLLTKGVEAIGLASTTIQLPEEISVGRVVSLNHAYTKLSEVFET